MRNNQLNLKKELEERLFTNQSPTELILKDGTLISIEPYNNQIDVWSHETGVLKFKSIEEFLNNFVIKGIKFKKLISEIESIY